MYVFFDKDDELLEKYVEIWEKFKNNIKKKLVVNLYTVKISKSRNKIL